MRSLKTFMKAKKPMWRCGECKCVTLQCRRENDEFCNCGEPMTFMTYNELVALGSVDAIINELNKNPRGYLNSLTEEGHTQQSPELGIELHVIVSHPDTPLVMDNKGFVIITHSDDPDLPTPLNTWVAMPYGPQPTGKTVTISVVNVDGDAESPMEAPISETCGTIEKQQVTVPEGTQWEIVWNEDEFYLGQRASIYFYNDDIENPIETVGLTPNTSSSSAGYAIYDACGENSDTCGWGEVEDNTTITVYFAKHAVYTVTIQTNDATKGNVDVNAVYVQTNNDAYVEPVDGEQNKVYIDGGYVTATPASGYMFGYWEDQDGNPIDVALQITSNITITAIFQEGR